MNKFKDSIDKIQMNENDKKRVLNNILNHKEKKNTFNVFIYRFATFLLIFGVAFGSGYALNKIFKLDEKLASYLNLNKDTEEQIENNGQDINIIKTTENYDINLKQIILGYYQIHMVIDMENIKNDYSLRAVFITKDKFNDDDFEITTLDDGWKEIFYNNNDMLASGFGTMETSDNSISYVTDFTSTKKLEPGNYTIRVYDNEINYTDISITIDKKDIKKITYDNKTVLYDKDNIKVINKEMIITNSDIYVEATSDQLEQINNLEYDILNFSEINIKTKDDILIKATGTCIVEDNIIKMHMTYYDDFINLDNIQSLLINDIEIKISD